MLQYNRLKHYREQRGYPWFTKPWDLNLFIARSNFVGEWDDLVIFAWTDDDGRECAEAFIATGDASEAEWTDSEHPQGCVWVKSQHVPGGLKLGAFKGRPALRQVKPFECVRWPKSKGYVPTVDELEALPAFVDNRGCHIHNRWNNMTPAAPKRGDSRGCTVILYPHHHVSAITLVKVQLDRHGTDSVSPTYCKLSDLT